jgi:hypothetical protein
MNLDGPLEIPLPYGAVSGFPDVVDVGEAQLGQPGFFDQPPLKWSALWYGF